MELEKKLSQSNQVLSADNLKLTRIYRRKVINSTTSDIPKQEDYEKIPSSIVGGVLDIVEKQTKSFYHFTRALSGNVCLDHCLEMKTIGHQEQCDLVVAKPIIGEDLQTGRKQIEYECSFYDYKLEFKADHSHRIPPLEAYQLMRPNNEDSHFDRLDAVSEPVQFVTESYDPVHTVTNAASKDLCLSECLNYKANNRYHNLIKSMDCQLVTVVPRIIQDDKVVDVSKTIAIPYYCVSTSRVTTICEMAQ